MAIEPEDGLQKDEEVKKFFRPSLWHYTTQYSLALLLLPLTVLTWHFLDYTTALIVVLSIGLLSTTELYRRGHKFFVTNERVVRQFKFFKKRFNQGTFDLVTDISVNQNILQRILKVGTIKVNTASGENIEFKGVKHPRSIKNSITEAKHDKHQRDPKTEKCENCEAENPDSSNYCSDCGEELGT